VCITISNTYHLVDVGWKVMMMMMVGSSLERKCYNPTQLERTTSTRSLGGM
jgi:hypothetical protein